MTKPCFITNAQNEKICVKVTQGKSDAPVAVLQHGLGGFKEQKHILALEECLIDSGVTVINFDSRHAFGESDGDLRFATLSSYIDDLETVVDRFSDQSSNRKIILAGHSLGGASILSFATRFPGRVLGIAPLSTLIGGFYYEEQKKKSDLAGYEKWRDEGAYLKVSKSRPGKQGYVSFDLCVDMRQYDFIDDADKLTMPVLMATGDEDTSTPYAHQKLLHDAIPHDRKEIHLIKDCGHTFKTPKQLAELKEIFSAWLTALLARSHSDAKSSHSTTV